MGATMFERDQGKEGKGEDEEGGSDEGHVPSGFSPGCGDPLGFGSALRSALGAGHLRLPCRCHRVVVRGVRRGRRDDRRRTLA